MLKSIPLPMVGVEEQEVGPTLMGHKANSSLPFPRMMLAASGYW